MGTATFRHGFLAVAALTLAVAFGGCGGNGTGTGSTPAATTSTTPAGAAAFAWLRPGPAPAHWHAVTIPTGATLPYPPGWHLVHGDAGTATAVLTDAHGGYLGYLNVTPRQSHETMADWTSFRVAHNKDENERDVTALAAAGGLRFRTGRGTCVRDSYTTSANTMFVEIACLVAGPKKTTVIVGAAPPRAWAQISPSLERAISAFTT